MTKKTQIIYSSILFVIGFISNSIAWTIAGPHPINTIFLLVGIAALLIGMIWFLILIVREFI